MHLNEFSLCTCSLAGGDNTSYEKGRNEDLFSEKVLWKIVSGNKKGGGCPRPQQTIMRV